MICKNCGQNPEYEFSDSDIKDFRENWMKSHGYGGRLENCKCDMCLRWEDKIRTCSETILTTVKI